VLPKKETINFKTPSVNLILHIHIYSGLVRILFRGVF